MNILKYNAAQKRIADLNGSIKTIQKKIDAWLNISPPNYGFPDRFLDQTPDKVSDLVDISDENISEENKTNFNKSLAAEWEWEHTLSTSEKIKFIYSIVKNNKDLAEARVGKVGSSDNVAKRTIELCDETIKDLERARDDIKELQKSEKTSTERDLVEDDLLMANDLDAKESNNQHKNGGDIVGVSRTHLPKYCMKDAGAIDALIKKISEIIGDENVLVEERIKLISALVD